MIGHTAQSQYVENRVLGEQADAPGRMWNKAHLPLLPQSAVEPIFPYPQKTSRWTDKSQEYIVRRPASMPTMTQLEISQAINGAVSASPTGSNRQTLPSTRYEHFP